MGAEGNASKMSKTQLDPSTITQLKKLFVENLQGKDSVLEYGKAKLAAGQYTVKTTLPRPYVSVTGIGTSTPTTYYVVDDTQPYKFTIISSSASDSGYAFWIAVGN